MLVGIGWRKLLAKWIASHPPEIQCLEITAEHFFDSGEPVLAELSEHYPIFVHGLGLSLGTPGPLDDGTLRQFQRVAKRANARWVSEHIAFTRTNEVDLGHLNPVLPSKSSLEVFIEHVRILSDACECPVLLENITTELQLSGEMPETEFIHELCDQADCGLLLDVTNLLINSKNHGFDPCQWLSELPRSRIRQLHVVGYGVQNGHYVDSHAGTIQDDLWDLIEHVAEVCHELEAVTLEWDHSFPPTEVLSAELERLEAVFAGACHASEGRT